MRLTARRIRARQPGIRIAILACCAQLLGPHTGAAQAPVDLDGYPRVDATQLAESYREWLEREVRWILTDQEREVFLRLGSDAQRDSFIEEFWRQRDPSPGTRRNEYRVEHYRRLEHATERLGRGEARPGWLTDRGRIYILLGEPADVVAFPNTQLAVPVEMWRYAADPVLGLPPFFYVLFYKRNGFGDYRLYSPLSDGPQELLNEAGRAIGRGNVSSGRVTRLGDATPVGDIGAMLSVLDDVDMELSEAAINLIPGAGTGLRLSPLRSEMLLADIADLPRRVMPSAAWAYRILTGSIDSEVRFETLPVAVRAVALRDDAGRPFLHLIVRAPANRLTMASYDGVDYLTFALSHTLLDHRDRVLHSRPEHAVEVGLEPGAASELRGQPLYYLDRIPVVGGDHRLGLMIDNSVSREFGRAEITVRAPSDSPTRVVSSPPLLVVEHQDLGPEYDPYGDHFAFQLGRNFVLPTIDGPFPAGGTLWVFHQLVAPQAAVEPVAASYRLEDSRGEVVAAKETALPLARKDAYGTLNQLTGVSLDGVAAGDYTLVVDLDLPGWEATALRVRIDDPQRVTAPFVHAPRLPPPGDPAETLERARQLRQVGDLEAAADTALATLSRVPDSQTALELTADLLRDTGRLEELRELLEPRLARQPDAPDLLLRTADLASRTDRHWDAVRYYERARLAGVPDTPELLNALASEYLAEERLADARRILGLSLELDPAQDSIRSLLARIATPAPR